MPMMPPTHNPYPGRKRARGKKIGDPFYTRTRWRRVRLMVLRRQPLCADPLDRHLGEPAPATEVDHVVPRLEAPELAYTLSNLRGLCKPCHSAITMLAIHAKRRGGGCHLWESRPPLPHVSASISHSRVRAR